MPKQISQISRVKEEVSFFRSSAIVALNSITQMFNLLRRNCVVNHGIRSIRASFTHEMHLSCLQNYPFIRLAGISTSSSSVNDEVHSFTVSYLMNTCGLSLKSALSASKYLHFDTPTKPDSVINLFKSHGFSQTQIAMILTISPKVLILNPESILLPKLKFLQSKGALGQDLTKIIQKHPTILLTSLENIMIPNYNFIRDLLGSDEQTIALLKRDFLLSHRNLITLVPPKMNVLRDAGVAESDIMWAFRCQPQLFCVSMDRLKTLVEEARQLGMDPWKSSFVWALTTMKKMSKCTWEKKVKVFKMWGWTSEEVIEAFKRFPSCMSTSEDKIMATMDVLVSEMGWDSSQIVKYPFVLNMSLENRIVPRVRVLKFLLSKGLLKKNPTLSTTFMFTEDLFFQKYVHCYKESPQLLKLYKNSLDHAAKPKDLPEKEIGLSLKSALSASKYLHFDTPTKPDSVINLFKSHGFSQTQIAMIITISPKVLILNPESILLPKLKFLQSKGALGQDLTKIIQKHPTILLTSLENFMIPNYNLIRDLLGSDEQTIALLKRDFLLFHRNLITLVPPKMNVLRDAGVAESDIMWAFRCQPQLFCVSMDRFKTLVEEARQLGMDPWKSSFVRALTTMKKMSKCTWEKKVKVFKRWGWTSEEVIEAFKRHPSCMAMSEDRIMVIMDIVVNKMGWEASEIVRYPRIFLASLKNRITPRVRVLQFLLSKGLIKKNPTLSSTFHYTEEKFLQKYVHCYKEGPQLLKLYKENSGLAAKPEDLAEGRNLVSAVDR